MAIKPVILKILTATSILFALVTIIALFIPFSSFYQSIEDYLNIFLFALILTGLIGFFLNDKKILNTNFLCAAFLSIFLKTTTNNEFSLPKRNTGFVINLAEINLNIVENTSFINQILIDTSVNVLTFLQCDPNWDYILDSNLKNTFPFQSKLVQTEQNGTTIYSKIPILNIDTIMLGNYPILQTSFTNITDTFQILTVYVPSKEEIGNQNEINIMHQQLHEFIYRNNRRSIIIGQFNQTYWFRDISHLKTTLHLNNTRRIIYPMTTSVPRDHIFYSNDLECYNFGKIIDRARVRIGSQAGFQIHQLTGSKPKIQ